VIAKLVDRRDSRVDKLSGGMRRRRLAELAGAPLGGSLYLRARLTARALARDSGGAR
jgi:hypothetical protein